MDRVTEALDTCNYVVGVFLDAKKAFDTIDHGKILMRKYYGIKINILNWLKSDLSDRSQYVEYNINNSEITNIYHGLPQESILGPL